MNIATWFTSGVDVDFLSSWSTRGIPDDGLGVDLIDLANRVYRSRTYEETKYNRAVPYEHNPFALRVAKKAQKRRNHLGQVGLVCENPPCNTMNASMNQPILKRCAKV